VGETADAVGGGTDGERAAVGVVPPSYRRKPVSRVREAAPNLLQQAREREDVT
jgi:hypothetical protein